MKFRGWQHSLHIFCFSRLPLKMPINFGNEEELKEYLENLGVEYRFGCFSEKNPEVCHLLGEYLENIKRDFHKAARIFKSNCDDENYPRSCQAYGNCLVTGQGVDKKNEDAALVYYKKGCSLGVGSSCFNAGMMTINPSIHQTTEKDYKQGLELLKKGCTLKSAFSCYFLSGMYIRGPKDKDSLPERDMKLAFEYAEKACNLNHLYACMNLSVMYRKGEGCEKNEEMASKINEKVEHIKSQLENDMEFQRGTF